MDQGNIKLVDLTLRFDGNRPDPDRFKSDPNDPTRPDPDSHAPHPPIEAAIVAGLIRQGNLNYAGFIQSCKAVKGEAFEQRKDVKTASEHWLFLNKSEVAIGDTGVTYQNPYAAVLGCIDARVPVELITGQASNDMFVIRTAGNILTELGEASGSMHYILSNYAVDAPHRGAHKSVSAILVLGHTKCGAVASAYDAFKPGGPGTVGLPPSLASILYEIKPAVDFVLGATRLTDPDDVKDAISMVNAVISHLKIKKMAEESGTFPGLTVFYGTYDVSDFYLHSTNIPDYPDRRFPQALAARGIEKSFSWSNGWPDLDRSLREALAQDATDFATRRRR
ncbi:MAG: carbonic anhydrase [Isosphaeraceae bacterium]|nr:carbonic anhydrase [Isosphaeraceae bacterium]